jgi:carbon starvation protein
MNVKGEAALTAAKVTSLGYPVTVEHMDALAKEMGEHTLFGRTGGAATLAVGMAQIFSKAVSGRWLDLWYHFAIMFEALFILTTLDAGTRVGRYILQDFLGNVWKPLGDTKAIGPNLLASGLMVAGWGTFLIQGVRDPLGGINSLWPLFGIANQMLAAIALCLATTIILKMAMGAPSTASARTVSQRAEAVLGAPRRSPALAFITLVPLVWLLSVTMTAGVQKIWHPDPRIGFLAQAWAIERKLPDFARDHALANNDMLSAALRRNASDEAAAKFVQQETRSKETWAAVVKQRTLRFNNLLDAFVAGSFLVMVSAIVLLSLREWILLLTRRKPTVLRESEPVWLPDYAVIEAGGKFGGMAGTAALTLALAKELSGEAHLDRAQENAAVWECGHADEASKTRQEIYLEVTEQRFKGVRRCC